MDTYTDWLNARENARQAIADEEREGAAKATATAAYYAAKAKAYTRLLFEGNSATAAQNLVKGEPDVNPLLEQKLAAEARYKAACDAADLFTNEEAHTYKEHSRAMAADIGR